MTFIRIAKGLRFLGKNNAVIDIKRHADIMEDAIDRIKMKEAMQSGEFVSWEEVESKINKKLGKDVSSSTNKKSRKKSAKSRQTISRKSS
jgi:hypothetical protein